MFDIRPGALPQLDPWGTVADLGSTILEGQGHCFGSMVHGTPDAPVSCGYFAVETGKFSMVYPFDEHAVVVEGKATLTDESTGQARTFGPGEGWFVAKGTPVLWHIHSDRFVKNYLAVA